MNSEFWNAIQAASNQAAGIVSGPVDIASWLLRKAGAPVPENALLSSKWMEEQGLMKSVKPGVGQMVGDTLGLLAPIAAAAKAPQIAAAAIKGGENLAAPRTLGTQRGIFMGDLSKTWDKAAADKARQMEKAGVDARKIWEDTGTFKGVDGKWRQEIDDSKSALTINYAGADSMRKRTIDEYVRTDKGQQVRNALSHGELGAAYNELPYTNLRPGAVGSQGGYNNADNVISIGDVSFADGRSTLLHELQHAVQSKEGFARGGSPSTVRVDIGWLPDKSIVDAAAALAESAAKWKMSVDDILAKPPRWMTQGHGDYLTQDATKYLAKTPEALKQAQAKLQQSAEAMLNPFQTYKRLAGEAEARAVQARMSLTAEQRRALFPLDSYDVPVDQLIVRQGSGPQMSILERNGQGLLNDPPKPPALLGLPERVKAFETAQINAAKPLSEGGLGLGPNNTAAERAKALGFDTPAYHGTASDISKINPAMYGTTTGANSAKKAFWAVDDATTARGYAEYAATDAKVKQLVDRATVAEKRGDWDAYDAYLKQAEDLELAFTANRLHGQNIMPLQIRASRPSVLDAKGAEFVDVEGGVNSFLRQSKAKQSDIAILQNLADDVGLIGRSATHYGILDPSSVRSRFAAFDPARRNEADLLGGADPYLLSLLGLGAGGAAYFGQK